MTHKEIVEAKNNFNKVFITTILNNKTKEEAIDFISQAITNRDIKIEQLEDVIESVSHKG